MVLKWNQNETTSLRGKKHQPMLSKLKAKEDLIPLQISNGKCGLPHSRRGKLRLGKGMYEIIYELKK